MKQSIFQYNIKVVYSGVGTVWKNVQGRKILKSKLQEIKTNFRENCEINEEVLHFLASEITSSIREMVGALNRIIAFTKIISALDLAQVPWF